MYIYIYIYKWSIIDIEHYLTLLQHWSFINSPTELVSTIDPFEIQTWIT